MRELIWDGERARSIQDLAPQELNGDRLIELAAMTLTAEQRLSKCEVAETLYKELRREFKSGLERLVNQIDSKLGEEGLMRYAAVNLTLKLGRG